MFQSVTWCVRNACRPVLQSGCGIYVQSTRNTVIVKRKNPLNLVKKGKLPRLKPRHYVFTVIDNESFIKQPPIDCILMQDVPEIGIKGQLVNVSRHMFRDELYPSGKAVYASPENIEDFNTVTEEEAFKARPTEGMKALERLAEFCLQIPMNAENPWTLNKTHVRVAFRRLGVEVKEDCILLPEEEIMSPKDFVLQLTLGDTNPVKVRAMIYSVHRDPEKMSDDAELPSVWGYEPLDSPSGQSKVDS